MLVCLLLSQRSLRLSSVLFILWVWSYSVVLCISHFKGHPGWGPALWLSVRCLMGQPLCCSAADTGVSDERGYGDDSTPYMWLSSITLLPWLSGFPPLAFPTTIYFLTSPQSISPHQQQPWLWDCSTIPKLQLPATMPSRRPGVCMAVARTVWFSFHLDQLFHSQP